MDGVVREDHVRRNWEALVRKAMGGREFRLTVLESLEFALHDGCAARGAAGEADSNRTIVRHLRRGLGAGKQQVSALGYWTAR
jgi:NADPH-dependent ferric siderophore reductase